MKIRTYVASSMPQALQQVREELGDDAVILNTRTLRANDPEQAEGDAQVEVTAGLEGVAVPSGGIAARPLPPRPAAPAQPLLARMYAPDRLKPATVASPGRADLPTPDLGAIAAGRLAGSPQAQTAPQKEGRSDRAIRPDSGETRARQSFEQLRAAVQRVEGLVSGIVLPEELSRLSHSLRAAGLAEDLAKECIQSVFQELDGEGLEDGDAVRRRAASLLMRRMPARRDIRVGSQRRVVAFVGASGAGKTTALAKIAAGFAAKYRQRGEADRIAIVTTDTRRIGSLDQAKNLAGLIDVHLEVAYDEEEMAAVVSRLPQARLVLVDTAGCGLDDGDERARQRRLLETAGVDEVHIVVDAKTRLDHMLDWIDATRDLGTRRLLFAKVDEARRCGAVLSAAARTEVPISYLTVSAVLPGGIEPGDLDGMVREATGARDVEDDSGD